MTRSTRLTLILLLAGVLRPSGKDAWGTQEAGAPGELSEREAAVHVLNRLGYGPRPGDVERVLEMGVGRYIEQQLHPETIPEDADLGRRLAGYETLASSTAELLKAHPPPFMVRRQMMRSDGEVDTAAVRMAARASYQGVRELGAARMSRAVYGEQQLQEVMVDFWLNHFNVFAFKGQIRYFLPEYERAVIRPHALGNFRKLLGSVARSPAMLFYLDNWLSAAPEGAPRAGRPPRRGRRGGAVGAPDRRRASGLNENYARELLELHTLGVDGGYTQEDVIEVARAFTGWTIDMRTGAFMFRPYLHDDGDKLVLGHRIKAGGGIKDGDRVLDLVARHPSTARFIAEKLARRFVADEPPESLIERAANTFTETDGDIMEVVRTIVTSPEFFSREAYRAKVKTPLEWLASSIRGLELEVQRPRLMLEALRRLDQPLYGAEPPTGYADVAEAWVSSGALLARADLAGLIAEATVRRREVRGPAADDSAVDDVFADLLPGVETERLHTVIESAGGEDAGAERRLRMVIALTLASPEFQRK